MESHTCFFCGKCLSPTKDAPLHPCIAKAYSLLTSISNPKKKAETIFHDIENLVFQGGGVKGTSYIGVLNKLQEENKDFLENVKRVAGSSAGSIIALYIALNLSPDKIAEFMNKNYLDLLDEGIALQVTVNYNDMDRFIIGHFYSPKQKNFGVKDVVFAAMAMFEKIKTLVKEHRKSEAIDALSKLAKNIFLYISLRIGFLPREIWEVVAAVFMNHIGERLISYFEIPKEEEEKEEEEAEAEAKEQAKSNLQGTSRPQQIEQDQPAPKEKVKRHHIHLCIKDAFSEACKDLESSQKNEKLNSMKAEFQAHMEAQQNKPGEALLGASYQKNSEENIQAEASKENNWKIFDFYRAQAEQPVSDLEDKSALSNDTIVTGGLAELILFLLGTGLGLIDLKERMGLFQGSTVKATLIQGAIKLRFEQLGRLKDYREDLTFKELYDFADKDGNKLFKPLFVTAYNPLSGRTEVLSAYHTPNAVVADAVKASSSIPGFFAPERIRENGEFRKNYYEENKDGKVKIMAEEIPYMDGGTMDNYPLWIFDDLKYCFDDIPGWVPEKIIPIQNPKSLGFRLMDLGLIDIYKNPYFDKLRKDPKRISGSEFQGSLWSIFTSVLSHSVADVENEHIKRGDCSRSVYIDISHYTAVSFNLTEDDRKKLIKAGEDAVEDYKNRARNNFKDEGQAYPHY